MNHICKLELDNIGHITKFCGGLGRVAGLQSSDFEGQSWLNLVVPGQRNALQKKWQSTLKEDKAVFSFSFNLLSTTTVLPVRFIFTVKQDRYLVFVEFLSGKNTKLFYQLKQKLETLYKSSAESIMFLDKNHRILDYNLMAEKLVSKRFLTQIQVGQDFTNYVQPDRLTDFEDSFKQVLDGHPVHKIRNIRANDDLSEAYEMSYIPIYDQNNELESICFTALSIEFQKNMETLLHTEKSFLSGILESANALIFVANAEGEMIRFNRACEILTGYELNELKNKPFWETLVVPEEQDSEIYSKECIRSGRFPKNYRSHWVSKHQENFSITWSNSVMYSQNGLLEYLVCVGIDTTRQAEVEKALEERDSILRQIKKMDALGFMASAVAHDFNNILTGIMGHTEQLKRYVNEKKEAQTSLEKIEGLSEKAARLTKELLFFSRKAEKAPLVPININQCIEETRPLFEKILSKKTQLDLVLNSTESLLLDRVHIEQLLINLLINAQDAMNHQGCIKVTTEDIQFKEAYFSPQFGWFPPGTYLRFSVLDQGSGIPDDLIQKIFTPFFTTKEKGEGTGLGLTIVLDIVKQYSGLIEVENFEIGAQISLLFPVTPKEMPKTSEVDAEEKVVSIKIGSWHLLEHEEQGLEEIAKLPQFESYRETQLTAFQKHAIEVLVLPLSQHPQLVNANQRGLAQITAKKLYLSDFSQGEIECIEYLNDNEDVIFRPLDLKELQIRVRRLLQSK